MTKKITRRKSEKPVTAGMEQVKESLVAAGDAELEASERIQRAWVFTDFIGAVANTVVSSCTGAEPGIPAQREATKALASAYIRLAAQQLPRGETPAWAPQLIEDCYRVADKKVPAPKSEEVVRQLGRMPNTEGVVSLMQEHWYALNVNDFAKANNTLRHAINSGGGIRAGVLIRTLTTSADTLRRELFPP